MTLSMTEAQFRSQEEDIKQGVATACGVAKSQVSFTVLARRLRRFLQSSVNIETKITTDTTDASTVANRISADGFDSTLQTSLSDQGVTTTVSGVTAPTTTDLAANSNDDDDSDSTDLIIIIVACCTVFVLIVGLVTYMFCVKESSPSTQTAKRGPETKGLGEGETGGAVFNDINNDVL